MGTGRVRAFVHLSAVHRTPHGNPLPLCRHTPPVARLPLATVAGSTGMIRQRQPIKRSPLPARTSGPPRKRAKPRRVSVLRDRGYLNWLRYEARCVVCKNWCFCCDSCEPAHGPVNGRGSKGPDNEAIPLCRYHHEEQHRLGWPAFESKYGFSREKEAAAHYAAFLLTGRL
jgi:hypothetical protein